MPVEKANCSSCGAPLHLEADQEILICDYCSTPNRIVRDQKGVVIAVNSQALDFIAQEAVIARSGRNIETLSRKKIELLEGREKTSRDKKAKWENEINSIKKKGVNLNKREWTFTCFGLLIWVAGITSIIITLLNGDWDSICIILPGGFILGFIFLYIANDIHGKRSEKELAPILVDLERKHQNEYNELERAYDDEITRISNELNKSKSLISAQTHSEVEDKKPELTVQLGFVTFREIRKLIRDDQKVKAIELLQEKLKCSLREALEYVEKLEKES